jgi:hypothetical protein
MAKLDLDYSKVSSGCNDNLEITIKKLNQIIRKFENLDIPFDCSKKEKIRSIKSAIVNDNNKLDNVLTWIKNSNSDFRSACEDCETRIARLPNVKFGKRR